MSTLRQEFQDKDYRRAYAESFANTVIATQIRLLRGPLTQTAFAAKVGMRQSRISAMEDENYSAWSTTILKQIAASNDVVFLGRFVSFGELLNWSRRLSEAELRAIPFAEDPLFHSPRPTLESASPAAQIAEPLHPFNAMPAKADLGQVTQALDRLKADLAELDALADRDETQHGRPGEK